ncbi:MAG: hypothetical protein AMJ69_05970 [Gammaproteobacteria bacterium SG8_47]|nr:MAG: hypothetical protein AMJ69_05970 [Gammaproteobacteria bacterium SG8_47]
MKLKLTPHQERVIGCLIEKEITTPEQYPLSLNALVNACNQKSNRAPVLGLNEATVQDVVDELVKQHLVSERSGFGSRVTKYQHRFCNSDFGSLTLSAQELAIVCELLLRGPQTPGELRAHAGRMAKFGDVHEVEQVLRALTEREDGPFVAKLAREPGRREARYAQLFGEHIPAPVADESDKVTTSGSSTGRLELLEQEVAALRAEVDTLSHQIQALTGGETTG